MPDFVRDGKWIREMILNPPPTNKKTGSNRLLPVVEFLKDQPFFGSALVPA